MVLGARCTEGCDTQQGKDNQVNCSHLKVGKKEVNIQVRAVCRIAGISSVRERCAIRGSMQDCR